MKRKTISALFIAAFLGISALSTAQEYRGAQLELTVSNTLGREQTLAAGIMEGATTGLDRMLGEAELPPPPPTEVFDARFVGTPGKSQLGTGSLIDYRPILAGIEQYTETYTIAYQGGQGATGVVLSWDDPPPGRVTRLQVDGNDMAGKTEIEVPFATGQITVVVSFNYAPLSFAANPSPLLFDANNVDPLPAKTLEIIPQGDSNAGWILTTDAEWLELNTSMGSGRRNVEVSIVDGLRPSGEYNAVIQVRSFFEPAQLDVPVTLRFTVGARDPSLPEDLELLNSFPNPAKGVTSIGVRLGALSGGAGSAALTLHDVSGRLVVDLSSRLQRVNGLQTVNFDASSLPAGAYTSLLRVAGYELSRALLIVR